MDAAATRAQIIAYYESLGYDAEAIEPYLDQLDDLESIDPEELSTEEWEMYMKLTLFKLWAILYPDSFQSYYASIGDDFTYENVYDYMPDDILAELSEDIYDDPMLMALFSSEAEAMLNESEAGSDYSWEGDDESLSYWGMDPDLYYLLTETQEGYEATVGSLTAELYELQEYDQALIELYNIGELTEVELDAMLDNNSMKKQLLMNDILSATTLYNQALEMIASMVDKENDLMAQLAQNTKIA